MPVYVFLCGTCGLQFEKLYRRVSDNKEEACTACDGIGSRQVTSASFAFSHPPSQIRGALPSNTGTSDDFNYEKTIGRDASQKWEKINENQSRKNKLVEETRKSGVGITKQHLVKTNDESGYRVMSEGEREVINERREIARVVNDSNLANNKQAVALAEAGTPRSTHTGKPQSEGKK